MLNQVKGKAALFLALLLGTFITLVDSSGNVKISVDALPFNSKLPEPPSGSFASSNVVNLFILLSSES